MLFERSLTREFASVGSGVFVALFSITVSTGLIRLLGQAATGKLASGAVAAMLGFTAVGYLPVLLSLALFIGVLMTLSRWYKDSEMTIWFSAGLSLSAWVRPVLRFALPLVAVIAGLSLFLSPWAASTSNEFRDKLQGQDEVTRISPGVFRESAKGDRVYFVESIAGDSINVQNVFISSIQHESQGVMMSRRGFMETMPNGDRFLVLLHGRRYDGQPGAVDYKVMDFERYAVRIEAKESATTELTSKTLSTLALMQDPTAANLAELVWRIGLPLSALMLALLAIPLSFANPRAGRSANLILALLTYMVYSNLVSIMQAWVGQEKVPFYIGVWVVHAIMLVVLAALFWRRLTLFSFNRLLSFIRFRAK